MIKAFITNLGKYNEGELCGEYLSFPTDTENVKKTLSSIGIDGIMYEEFFITDYATELRCLHEHLGEYESIDELNYLAAILSGLDDCEEEKFVAALEYGERTSSVMDLINLTQNLDNYEFYPGVEDDEGLGRWCIEELSMLEVPESMEQYFDYEAYGRDTRLNSEGTFSRELGGYVERNSGKFIEHYSDRDEFPDEYRVFAYPDPPQKMPIKEQLEMFGNMASSTIPHDKQMRAIDERA